MSISRIMLAAVIAFGPVAAVAAQEAPTNVEKCPIDTTTDQSTGKPRSGAQVCGGDGSASVGFSATGSDVKHFLEYPIGTSDKSVAKQIGNSVHHFFSHL